MSHGKIGRGLMGPLLIVNLVVYVVIIGLASWSLDKFIDGRLNHPHLGGNRATPFMLAFALAGGTMGVVSLLAGLLHSRAWRLDSMAVAASSAALAWAVMAVAFGFVWKEIRMGGRRGKRLQTVEVLVVVSTLIQMLYIMLLHAGSLFSSRYGPCYGGAGGEAASSAAATATAPRDSLPVSTGAGDELGKAEASGSV